MSCSVTATLWALRFIACPATQLLSALSCSLLLAACADSGAHFQQPLNCANLSILILDRFKFCVHFLRALFPLPCHGGLEGGENVIVFGGNLPIYPHFEAVLC